VSLAAAAAFAPAAFCIASVIETSSARAAWSSSL
jgi:hypothetical protein